MSSFVLTVLLVFCLLLIAHETFAQIDNEGTPTDGKIEIIYPAEALAPYKERRSNWSTTFQIGVDMISPTSFRSRVPGDSNNRSYEDLFGSYTLDLIQAQLGLKYNFGLGSIGVAGLIGYGSIDGKEDSIVHELSLMKKGGSASFIMDNLFSEPYLAPYVEGQFFTFDYEETQYVPGSESNIHSSSAGTDMTTALVVGVLIQLNKLDPSAALAAQQSMGLNNVFADLFVSQYNTSASEDDPNFETGVNFGAGMRMEF